MRPRPTARSPATLKFNRLFTEPVRCQNQHRERARAEHLAARAERLAARCDYTRGRRTRWRRLHQSSACACVRARKECARVGAREHAREFTYGITCTYLRVRVRVCPCGCACVRVHTTAPPRAPAIAPVSLHPATQSLPSLPWPFFSSDRHCVYACAADPFSIVWCGTQPLMNS